jgi:hypothetical protein
MSYATEYQASIDAPETFWADKAKQLPWFKVPKKYCLMTKTASKDGLPMVK